jgi:hypothetical protein
VNHSFKSLKQKMRLWGSVGLLWAGLQSAWAIQPVSAPVEQVLEAQAQTLSLWQLAENPEVFIFDFPGLAYQGRSFNRITQFTEQQFNEPYPRVLNNQELASYIQASRRTQSDFAFGHDVLVSELVQFFNYALRDKIQLNPEEVVIRDFLLEQGLIRFWRGFYQGMRPDVVVLAVPQVQNRKPDEPMVTAGARYAILLHELAHAEYYTNIHFRKFCQRFWYETLQPEQRDAFKRFLANFNYAVNNEELLINEMQAYLMFTPDRHSFSARKLGVSEQELQSMRAAFRSKVPPIALPMPGDM